MNGGERETQNIGAVTSHDTQMQSAGGRLQKQGAGGGLAATKRAQHEKHELVSRVIASALPAAKRRTPGILLGVLADACVVGLLALSMWLIVRAGEQPPILWLTFAIVGVRALAIGRAAFRYTERLASHDAALRQLARLRHDTFAGLIPRVPGGLAAGRGDVLSAFVDDVDQLQDEALRVRQPLIVSGVVVGLSVLAVAVVSPPAGLTLFVCLLLAGLLAAGLSKRMSAASDRELAAARARLADVLLERMQAAEVLAEFGAEDAVASRIRDAEDGLARVQLRRVRSAGLTGALFALLSGIASLIILLLTHGVQGGLSAPMFACLVVVPAAVFEVFAQVPAALVARRAVRSSALRVAELTVAPLPPEIPAPAVEAAENAGGEDAVSAARILRERDAASPLLTVEKLQASYPGSARPALAPVSFSISPGEVLVVTGESGAGKSTLALALVRLLEYTGEYRVCGREARTLPERVVRQIVGLCEQQPHLFASDLRQNLKFAHDTASDEELLAVLRRVGLGEFAAVRGLDAELGEHGQLVSGGQAQRIAFARAILADFPVVVLDEPTAGVDQELADSLLADLLGAVPEDRAVILITHTELPAGVPARTLHLSPAA